MSSIARVVRPDDVEAISSPQAQALQPMVTRCATGSAGISGAVVRMPPGGVSNAHMHAASEIVVVVLSGRAVTLAWEDGIPQPLSHGPGDMCFVPAGVPHCAVNLDEDAMVLGIEFRTNAEFTDVTVLPELQEQAEALVPELRRRHAGETVPDDPFELLGSRLLFPARAG